MIRHICLALWLSASGAANAAAQGARTIVILVRHAEKAAAPTVRSRETARPTAVADAVMKHAGKTVLVVGHSNTVAAIVAALGGPKLADLCDTQYSMLTTMVLDGQTVRVIRSSYGIATPDTPEACPATSGSVRPAPR